MPRYVVLEFADNADAAEFVQRVNDENAEYRNMRVSFRRSIVGVFVKPGKICTCSGWEKGNSGAKDWPLEIGLGEKFGWWVCSHCNRPRRGGHQLNNQLDMAETYEGVIQDGYEFGVTSLDISSFFHGDSSRSDRPDQVQRPKKFRRKKVKKNAG